MPNRRSEESPDYPDPYERPIIVEPLPKSTLLVGGALWAVLFALQVWQLSAILLTKDKLADQSREIAVMNVRQDVYAREVNDLKSEVTSLATTVRSIESRQLQAVHP